MGTELGTEILSNLNNQLINSNTWNKLQIFPLEFCFNHWLNLCSIAKSEQPTPGIKRTDKADIELFEW